MTDDVTNVSESPSEARLSHILDRMEVWAEDHPEATSYMLMSELEAEELLLAMAAALKLISRDVNNIVDKDIAQNYARTYRKVVVQGAAMDYIRTLNKSDEIEIYGLKIKAPRVVLQ